MRNLLLTVTLGALVAGFQTVAMAQPAGGGAPEGSRAYCEAKWNAQANHTESYADFMDKCMTCEAKWDEMAATNSTNGQDRSAYLRRCSKGAYWWGGNNLTPALLLLGLGGGLAYVGLHNDSDSGVSPQ